MNPGRGVALEAAILRALAAEWAQQNASRFGRALRVPVFRLDDSDTRLGGWFRVPREIVFSRALLRSASWGVVVEVLKHEMAHQYAHEVLGAIDETAHGPAFREVCRRYGIDASASGLPVDNPTETFVDHRVMRRITKLLALAESPNLHEAQAAMNAAQALLLRHNLSRTDATTDYAWRHLGPPAGRLSAADRMLGGILLHHFFVEAIWVPVFDLSTGVRGQVLEICGPAETVELAAYVHAFLRATAQRLWLQARAGAPKGGQRAFIAGVMRGFYDRLQEQKVQHQEVGLVWLGDKGAARYLRERHPRQQRVHRQGPRRTEAWEEGRAAGRQIVLHKPVKDHGGTGGKLLA